MFPFVRLHHRRQPRALHGFTLIEVMIVVAIVAILAVIAIPSYRDYVQRGQLVSGTALLTAGRNNMERFYQDHRTYAAVGAILPPCDGNIPAAQRTSGLFVLTCAGSGAPTLTGYTLTATGSNGVVYTVDQPGNQGTKSMGSTGWPAAIVGRLLGDSARPDMLTNGHPTASSRQPLFARGFTLVELMVAITVLALLLLLGLPSMGVWIQNSRVRSAAEVLQMGIRTAQIEALRSNRQVVMTFTNDPNPTLNPNAVAGGRNWSIQSVPSLFIGGNVAEFLGSGVLSNASSGISIAGIGAGYAAICFNSNGRLIGSGPAGSPTENCAFGNPLTSFTVSMPTSASDHPLQVSVALGGQVRICDPNRPARSSASPDGC